MSSPIRVAIVEDDSLTREALALHIRADPGFVLTSIYKSGEEALAASEIAALDVVLMDINLPGCNGIECVSKLKAAHPKVQFLMLTVYDENDLIFSALKEGASGYILKRASPEELVAAVKDIHAGGSPMSATIARKVVSQFHKAPRQGQKLEGLTPRENEILSLLAKGSYYKEIAEQLGISINTVRNHLHGIYGKLHVQSRTEAVVKYLGS